MNTPRASGIIVRQPAVLETGDTAHPRLLASRTKHDSIAFASAVAFGRRMMAKWPTPPTPLPGSILPDHRIVAFYGNPLATKMGVLGEYPVDVMLAKLDTAAEEWQRADPSTPVQPALQLIAVVAQGTPGRGGMVDPHVQIVMDMDGWGPPWMKCESYRDYIDVEPVEYTGFKLFLHNDVKLATRCSRRRRCSDCTRGRCTSSTSNVESSSVGGPRWRGQPLPLHIVQAARVGNGRTFTYVERRDQFPGECYARSNRNGRRSPPRRRRLRQSPDRSRDRTTAAQSDGITIA